MDKDRVSKDDEGGLGAELERLLARVPPAKAPAWFSARTLARLREENARKEGRWSVKWRWAWVAGAAGVVAGWMLWEKPRSAVQISDAEVFAALDALVKQDEENRWWVGL